MRNSVKAALVAMVVMSMAVAATTVNAGAKGGPKKGMGVPLNALSVVDYQVEFIGNSTAVEIGRAHV